MSGASITERAAGSRQGPAGRLLQPILDADLLGRYGLGIAVLAGAYYAGAHLGYAFEFSGPVAAIVWLPAGIGIAFLYLFGLRFWPGVVIGDLLVNNYSALPLGSALGQSVGNLLEVLIATRAPASRRAERAAASKRQRPGRHAAGARRGHAA